jgi:hypothetical protein
MQSVDSFARLVKALHRSGRCSAREVRCEHRAIEICLLGCNPVALKEKILFSSHKGITANYHSLTFYTQGIKVVFCLMLPL